MPWINAFAVSLGGYRGGYRGAAAFAILHAATARISHAINPCDSAAIQAILFQLSLLCAALCLASAAEAQKTIKPVLHGKHWVAVTGKPLAATAGGMTFARGGNAVDAACAMLAARPPCGTRWAGAVKPRH